MYENERLAVLETHVQHILRHQSDHQGHLVRVATRLNTTTNKVDLFDDRIAKLEKCIKRVHNYEFLLTILRAITKALFAIAVIALFASGKLDLKHILEIGKILF